MFLGRLDNEGSYQGQRGAAVVVHGDKLMTGGSVFEFDILVLAREPPKNTFFRYYLYLLIMREADIPHRFVYILPGSSSRSSEGNVAGRLRRVFVMQMSLPTNKQNSPCIPVTDRQSRNRAKNDNLAGLTVHTESSC